MKTWVVQCSLMTLIALGAPLVSLGIEARFDAGNTTSAVDGYVGMFGDGWTTEWQSVLSTDAETGLPIGEPTVSVLTSADPGFTELAAGSGNYLSFAATNTNKCAVSRGYDAFSTGFDATQPHTISWKIRIDEDVQNEFGTYDTSTDRYFICDSPAPVNGTTHDNSWSIFSFATDFGTLSAKNWGVFDGSLNNSGLSGQRIVDTGIPLVGGTVYDMEITVDPANRIYATSISDGTNTFYQEGLRFRTAEYSVGKFLSFGIHSLDDTDQRQFSLDDISIQQTTIDWDLPTQIEARFSDGNSSLPDGFRGGFGGGWNADWKLQGNGNGSMTGITPPTQVVAQGDAEFLAEVSPGSGAYFDYRMSPKNDGVGQASAGRLYDIGYGEFDASVEHTIEFEIRIDEDLSSGQFSNWEDRYAFFGAPTIYDGTKSGCSWMIMGFGADDGSGNVSPLSWSLYDGLKDGGSFDTSLFVDSGIAMESGVTYQFEVTVDPVNGEYDVTISNGTDTFTATDLGYRTADFDTRYVTFNGRGSTADEMRHMAIDNILIYNDTAGPQPLEGDLNGDGMVGSADLDVVRANWGTSVTPGNLELGDPSGDGSVGSADLDIVRANWGNTAAAAVPEPSATVLLLCGMLGLLLGKRRAR